MDLTIKNFLKFAILYVVSLYIANLIAALIVYYDAFHLQLFPIIIGGYYSYSCLPFPTLGRYVATLPPEVLGEFEIKYNLLGILLSLLMFIFSYYLVFQKKVRFWNWFIFFTIISLVVITYFKLERGGPPVWKVLYSLITKKPIF